MDIHSGVISGFDFSSNEDDPYKYKEEPQNVYHWFFVVKPDIFLDSVVTGLRLGMDGLLRKIRAVKKAEGFDLIFTREEPQSDIKRKRKKEKKIRQLYSVHEG